MVADHRAVLLTGSEALQSLLDLPVDQNEQLQRTR